MSFTARDWMQSYEVVKKRIQVNRSQGKGALLPTDVLAAKNTANSLENQLKIMTNNPLEYEICSSELARRGVLLENLRNLIAFGTISKQDSSSGAQHNPILGEMGLVQQNKQIIALQDDMIMDIGKGMDRLANQANTMNEEAKVQSKLLQSMEQDTDRSTLALQNERKHMVKVDEATKMCWSYICIAVEVILLFILIILGFIS